MIKKIVGKTAKSRVKLLIHLRHIALTLLIISAAEPMIVTKGMVYRSSKYLISASFLCFLLEIFLKNTIFHKIP
jgi:hypothetical protein